jgi:uncharacterized membrane protein YfcA
MSIAAVIGARFASIKSGLMNQAILRKVFAGLLYSIAIFSLLQTWVIA